MIAASVMATGMGHMVSPYGGHSQGAGMFLGA